MLCDADYEDGKIKSITVANKKGLTKYVAKMYIDCTGDADIVEFAGLPYEKSDSLQPSLPPLSEKNIKSRKNANKIKPSMRLIPS